MIYIFDEIDKMSDDKLAEWKKYLSSQRAEKTYRYIKTVDQKTSMMVYLLLRYALYKEYSYVEAPEFAYGVGKKPYIENSEINFNLSHSHCGVICGVSSGKIGVDIQDEVKEFSGIAKSVLTEAELESIGDSSACFTDIWTIKEAYGKYTCEGITFDMKNTGFDNIKYGWNKYMGLNFYNENRGRYSFSVCCEVPDTIIDVSLRDIAEFLNNIK